MTEMPLNKLKRLRPLDVSADTVGHGIRYMYYNCLGLLKLDINNEMSGRDWF